MKRLLMLLFAIILLLCGTSATPTENEEHQVYTRVNLVSDIAGVARFSDSNLVNPWGLGFSATSPFWVADNNAGVSTLYNGRGQAFPVASPLAVHLPVLCLTVRASLRCRPIPSPDPRSSCS